MNKCHFIGNLVSNPEGQTTRSGSTLCVFTIAINARRSKRANETDVPPVYLECEAWDTGADMIVEHFQKGDPIIVHGGLRSHHWQTPEGDKRSKIRLRVEEFEFPPKNPPRSRQNQLAGDFAEARSEAMS